MFVRVGIDVWVLFGLGLRPERRATRRRGGRISQCAELTDGGKRFDRLTRSVASKQSGDHRGLAGPGQLVLEHGDKRLELPNQLVIAQDLEVAAKLARFGAGW